LQEDRIVKLTPDQPVAGDVDDLVLEELDLHLHARVAIFVDQPEIVFPSYDVGDVKCAPRSQHAVGAKQVAVPVWVVAERFLDESTKYCDAS
jgi:hypothetical protein